MKPFLLNLKSDAHAPMVPTVVFDERLSLNVACDTGVPLASTSHLLATSTKTEAVPERDDDDPDYSIDESPVFPDTTSLATLTKTSAEKESDDSD
jgi:hypothetical protein